MFISVLTYASTRTYVCCNVYIYIYIYYIYTYTFFCLVSHCCGTRVRVEMSSGRSRRGGGGRRRASRYSRYDIFFN
jgi:hypothetical protein